jgi:hypothetical protein
MRNRSGKGEGKETAQQKAKLCTITRRSLISLKQQPKETAKETPTTCLLRRSKDRGPLAPNHLKCFNMVLEKLSRAVGCKVHKPLVVGNGTTVCHTVLEQHEHPINHCLSVVPRFSRSFKYRDLQCDAAGSTRAALTRKPVKTQEISRDSCTPYSTGQIQYSM